MSFQQAHLQSHLPPALVSGCFSEGTWAVAFRWLSGSLALSLGLRQGSFPPGEVSCGLKFLPRPHFPSLLGFFLALTLGVMIYNFLL